MSGARELHVGKPCSCGATACDRDRTAYVAAYTKTQIGEGPPLDGFARRRRRAEARRRYAEDWQRVQQGLVVA